MATGGAKFARKISPKTENYYKTEMYVYPNYCRDKNKIVEKK